MPSPDTPAPLKGIESPLRSLAAAFAAGDAALLEGVYLDDAEWVNAFGAVRRGAGEILAYLRELFADPRFRAGEAVAPPQVEVRLVAPRVAVARTYCEIVGQRTVDGGTLPKRRNHSLKVLVKGDDDRWRIASEMYMDARDETTHPAEAHQNRS